MPAAQHAARVGIIPTLKRKIAIAAAIDKASAQGSTLAKLGASNDNGNARIGMVSRNRLWIANQIARLRTTPTIAAVTADKAAFKLLTSRSFSANGAPKKIQRKQGTKVIQVASKPPSVPANIGGRLPGSRYAPINPTNCRTLMSGPGIVSAMPS